MIHGLIGLLALVFWLWMLIDAIRNPRLTGNQRLVWILVHYPSAVPRRAPLPCARPKVNVRSR